MRKLVIVCSVSIAMLLASACTTKRYVRQQVEPLINKVNKLDERTAENTKQISSTGANLQQALGTLNTDIENIDNNVNDTNTRAQRVQETTSRAQTKVAWLSDVVDKLDTYHVVSQAAVQFAFGKSRLDSKARQDLDQFSIQVSAARNCLVVVEGRTDGVGDDSYNNDLSERRANQVVRYLIANHDLQPFKVHAIGLGKARPVASNNTAGGRKANRRVDITLMSSAVPAPGNTANEPSSDDEVGMAGPPVQ